MSNTAGRVPACGSPRASRKSPAARGRAYILLIFVIMGRLPVAVPGYRVVRVHACTSFGAAVPACAECGTILLARVQTPHARAGSGKPAISYAAHQRGAAVRSEFDRLRAPGLYRLRFPRAGCLRFCGTDARTLRSTLPAALPVWLTADSAHPTPRAHTACDLSSPVWTEHGTRWYRWSCGKAVESGVQLVFMWCCLSPCRSHTNTCWCADFRFRRMARRRRRQYRSVVAMVPRGSQFWALDQLPRVGHFLLHPHAR